MEKLTQQVCTACRSDAPKVTPAEVQELKPQIPEWELKDSGGVPMLEKVYKFEDFAGALSFTQKVGELAESEGHHPAILLEWGKATVQWWTHKIKGLHRNDFICAAKTDELYRPYQINGTNRATRLA